MRMQRHGLHCHGDIGLRQGFAEIGMAPGQFARGVHTPAEQRALGDAVGGETPDQQAVDAREFDPRSLVSESDNRLVARRRDRQIDGQGDNPAASAAAVTRGM